LFIDVTDNATGPQVDSDGFTALMTAAGLGHLEVRLPAR
jgi:hypothetical protein